jgi:hypothetical protein
MASNPLQKRWAKSPFRVSAVARKDRGNPTADTNYPKFDSAHFFRLLRMLAFASAI